MGPGKLPALYITCDNETEQWLNPGVIPMLNVKHST